MGIADMNFRVAPCVTKALNQRIQHENWGYLDTAPRSLMDALVHWNRQRYGVVEQCFVKNAQGCTRTRIELRQRQRRPHADQYRHMPEEPWS
jgi:hypothetical protein